MNIIWEYPKIVLLIKSPTNNEDCINVERINNETAKLRSVNKEELFNTQERADNK